MRRLPPTSHTNPHAGATRSGSKSLSFFTRILLNRTKEGDTVFDPFSGVASTAVAAMLNNRRYIGCELDKVVFEHGNKRLDDINHLKIYRNIFPFKMKKGMITDGNLK